MIDLYYVGLVQWLRNGDVKTVCIARDFKTCEALLNQWLSEDGNGETHENYGISSVKAEFVDLEKPAS